MEPIKDFTDSQLESTERLGWRAAKTHKATGKKKGTYYKYCKYKSPMMRFAFKHGWHRYYNEFYTGDGSNGVSADSLRAYIKDEIEDQNITRRIYGVSDAEDDFAGLGDTFK